MKRSILCCLATCLLFTVNSIAQDNTVESLSKELEGLEYKLDALNARLPFGEMAIMTLVASDQNLKKSFVDGDSLYRHEIRIDNPLCNGNPKAIILITYHAEFTAVEAFNIFYNPRDQFWYIKTPDWKYKGFIPGITVDLTNPKWPAFKELNEQRFNFTYGIGYAGPNYPGPGQTFSVAIFTEASPFIKTVVPVIPVEPTPRKDETTVIDTGGRKVVPLIFPVTGEWQYKMASASGSVFQGRVFIVESGNTITGHLFISDKTKTEITGTLINGELLLRRVTGLETTQVYQLARVGKNRFSGKYSNEGRYPDSGTIEFTR